MTDITTTQDQVVAEKGGSLLTTRDVTVTYDLTHEALHKTSLSFEGGQVTALIGPSGCGKIGMVFQQPTPFRKSIRENILFAPKKHGRVRTKDEEDELVETSLRQAALWDEVKDKLRQSAHALSGGQQQRLCIARTLAMKPDVVLFDEPCSALDPISTFAIEETIRDIASSGICEIIVTHNMEQATRVSDRTAFFYVGDMVETGTTQQIFSNPQDQRLVDYLTGRFG